MADCLNCHEPMPHAAARCPRCGADVEKMRALLTPRGTFGAQPGRPATTAGTAPVQSFPMMPVVLLLVAVGAVIYFLWPKTFPQVVLTPAKANTAGTDP